MLSFFPTPADSRAAKRQLEQLKQSGSSLSPRLVEVMADMLSQLAAGRAIQVTAVETEIGTQQAADLLHVSRPYLVKMLKEGALPYRQVGSRRRVHLEDVLAYKAKLDEQRRLALAALADDLQDLNLA